MLQRQKYDATLLKGTYVKYAIYIAPTSPRQAGRLLCTTPNLDTAIGIMERADEEGRNYLMKGVKEDGTEVLFI